MRRVQTEAPSVPSLSPSIAACIRFNGVPDFNSIPSTRFRSALRRRGWERRKARPPLAVLREASFRRSTLVLFL